jgi:hypothetical protein
MTNNNLLTAFDRDELDDDTALELMRLDCLALATKCADDARRLMTSDFSDDDTDYMPARAAILSDLIASIANSDMTPADALIECLNNDDFRMNLECCDFPTNIRRALDYSNN